MKGDFSKYSFRPGKHYHGVLLQQGRVLLDADWNEQGSIASYRTETGTLDIVGPAGAPMLAPGFGLTPLLGGSPPQSPGDIRIGKGRFYVDGILCENDADVLFANQPDYDATPLPTTPGIYAFYLDVWLRHLTVAEAADIREVALGGPDTTTRTKTVWQVKYFKTPAPLGSPPAIQHCLTPLPAEVTQYSTGALSARSELDTGTSDPCGLVASGGYKRLENQLYRVEIHNPGDRSVATFKWSRDNGSVIARWEAQDPIDKNKLIVSSLGRDEILSFRTGDWVELIDDSTDLLNKPGTLAQLLTAEGNTIVLDPASIRYPAGVSKVEIGSKNPRIRRWDSAGELKPNANNATWLPLEDGVEVRFEAGSYKTGDYWLIPARTAKADVEWPFATPQPAQGIRHHFAKLAMMELRAPNANGLGAGWFALSDCRPMFPAVTELTSLFYISGDGQGAKPAGLLGDTLRVGVSNGEWPVAGARIRFKVVAGGGSFEDGTTEFNTTTNAAGIAECKRWKLGAGGVQHVQASLLDASGTASHLPILFTADLNLATNIHYDGGECSNWPGRTPTTVAEALTSLCQRSSSGGGGCSVTVGKNGQYQTLKDAFNALANQSMISICLLPQETAHPLENLTVSGKTVIRISGSAANVEMKATKVIFSARTVVLEGLNINNSTASGYLSILADDSETRNCAFTRIAGDTSNTPFIRVDGIPFSLPNSNNPLGGPRLNANGASESFATIHWNDNVFQANVALGLGERVRGYVVNNIVSGSTFINYTDKLTDASFPTLTADQRKRFEDALKGASFAVTGDMLVLRGNRMDRVLSNAGTQVYPASGTPPPGIKAYSDLLVSDNIFLANANSFVATTVSFSNNHFKFVAEAIDAFIVAHNAVVSGNMLASTSSRIDSLVDSGRKMISANLGTVI